MSSGCAALVIAVLASSIFQAREPMRWRLSDEGLRQIMNSTGYHPRPYNDGEPESSALLYDRMYHGLGNCRIGYGRFLHYYACHPEETIEFLKEKDARAILIFDLVRAEITVNDLVSVPLTQGQFDVLVAFVYSCGRVCFEESKILPALNNGDYREAARAWLHTGVVSAGEFVPLWEDQRRDEARRFLSAGRAWRRTELILYPN